MISQSVIVYNLGMEKADQYNNTPNIFEYYDYRLFLRDLVEYERKRNPVFSNRYIVRRAGFKSPTALKHVIDGKRNLSLESANKFASALKIEGSKGIIFLHWCCLTRPSHWRRGRNTLRS